MTKLNLTVLLKHFDLRNFNIYEAHQSNEIERKELERMLQYILPLWVSGIANAKEQAVILLEFNKYINDNWWELNKHPALQAKLLASIGLNKQVRHDFQYRHKKSVAGKLTDFLSRRYPDIRQDEIAVWCKINTEKNLLELFDDCGVQKTERDAILSEYRKLVED